MEVVAPDESEPAAEESEPGACSLRSAVALSGEIRRYPLLAAKKKAKSPALSRHP